MCIELFIGYFIILLMSVELVVISRLSFMILFLLSFFFIYLVRRISIYHFFFKESSFGFIDFICPFSVLNLINFSSYIYNFLSSVCFG